MLLEAPQRLILDKSPTGYCLVGSDGSVRWINNALQSYIGHNIASIHEFSPEVRAWISSRIEYAVTASDAGEKHIFFREWGTIHMQPLDSEHIEGDWLLSFPTLKPASDREVIFYETVFQACPIPMYVEDFSAVDRYLKSKLPKSPQELRDYLENDYEVVRKLADLVIIKDVNQAALDIMKISKGDIVGRLTKTLREPTYPAFIEELVAISEGKTHLEIEAPIDTANKRLNQTRIYIRFPDDPKHLTNVFVTIVDIDPYVAERRSLEEQREHAVAASRSKSEFVATLSHEMRTPLNGIVGFAELLSHAPPEDDSSEFVKSIQTCSNTLQALIDDVLDFTKIEAGEMQIRNKQFSIASIIENLGQIFRNRIEAKGIKFEVTWDHEIPESHRGDPLRITQILNNLLSNAEKFTRKGSISIKIRKIPNSDNIQFLVKDTGVGIDEAALKRVFQPFKQAEPFTFERFGGTGLGLAISLKFAEMMGGSLHIEPGMPYGTVAILQLPLPVSEDKQDSPEDADNKGEEPAKVETQVRLLAVDDNDINLRLISHFLKHRPGIHVELAESGERALELMAETEYDAVLMDLHMPGIDGFEATSKIRAGSAGACHKNVPIAAITAHTTDENRQKAQEVGMNAFIVKPMKPKEVFSFLEEFTRAT
ncbi:MAG: response regulator [Opitutales bacterium]